MEIKQEKDLYPIVKQNFKEKGFAVYAEVAHYLRGIDLVAVSDEEHVAVELKMSFDDHVVRQAGWDSISFDHTHYSNHKSLAGCMSQWRGFTLKEFKKEIGALPIQERIEIPSPQASLI